MRKGRGAVRHHGVRCCVELVVVRVQEDCVLPEVVPLASVDELRDVQLCGVQLDEVHKLLRLVLGVQDGQLCVHADVRTLMGEAAVQEADELLEVTVVLVLRDQLLQVIWVHDDVHARDLRATELLRLHARNVDLLPRLGVVGLASSLHSLGVLTQLHMARGQLGVVGDGLVQDLGRLVGALVVQAVAHVLDVCSVGAADKLLHVTKALGLRIGVDKLGVDKLVLGGDPGHLQVAHELLVVLLALRGLDDLHVVRGVLGLEVGLHGLGRPARAHLGPAELAPDGRVVAARRELPGTLQGAEADEEGVHGLAVQVALLVDEEGLLVEAVRLSQRDLGDLGAVVAVQAVDVVHDPRLVGLDGREYEEVLQVPVLAEVGGLVEDDLLQELDELVGEVCGDEGLDRGRDLVGAAGLRQGGGHNLVDDVAAVLALRAQRQRPELGALALHEVASLQAEEAVLVRDVQQLLIAGPPGALVCSEGQVRVAVLAVLAHGGRVIPGIGLEECLRVPVRVDADLRQGIVQGRLLVALGRAAFEPREQQPQAVPPLGLCDQLLHGARGADALQEAPDEVLGAVQVDERADDLRALAGADLEDVDLDVLHEGVAVEVLGQLADVAVEVADIDQGPRVRQLRLHQELLHLERLIHRALAAHPLHLLHVAATAGSLDVLEVHVRVAARRQDGAEEVEDALVGAEALEHLHDLLGTDLLVVLDCDLHRHVEVLPVVPQEVVQALQGRLGRHAGKVRRQELRRHLVRMQHHALEIRGVLVVLQRPLHKARLFTELADHVAVVMGEHVHLQDGLGHLRRLLQVHRQQLRLQVGLVGPVLLQRLEQDGGGLLQPVLVHEDLHDLVHVNERRLASLALQQALREVCRPLRVGRQHVLQQERVVGLVANFLHVGHNLLVLALLHEASDHLLVRVGPEVDGQCKLRLQGPDNVAQLLRALKLVLFEPLLHELPAVLLHHRPRELDGLQGVQLAVFQQRGEVVQDGRRLPRRCLHALELLDGLGRPEDAALALRCDERG
mmetsp:Transcript_108987/g.351891  ORF Transcript_108987/g.351891 Transcript_108987/m.351891 type:complete len:1017 (-) Transcript_108987:616-3666(-)